MRWNVYGWNTVVWNGSADALLSFEASLRTRLTDHTGYPLWAMQVPQGKTGDQMVYTLISRPHEHQLSGSAGVANASVQIDCYSDTHSGCRAMAESVRNSLQGFGNDYLCDDGVWVLCSLPERAKKSVTRKADGSDRLRHRYSLEYAISYIVDIPSLDVYQTGTPDGTPIEDALVLYLGERLGVSIWAEQRPQGSEIPCVVWHDLSIDYGSQLSGADGVGEAVISLTSYATSYQGAIELDESIRLSLDGYRGVMHGADILSILIEDDQAAYEAPASGADAGLYPTTSTYRITYLHDLPTLGRVLSAFSSAFSFAFG